MERSRILRKHTNHCLFKEIVATAERSHLAIAIEDLTHVRQRVKATRIATVCTSFAQLRQVASYEATMRGVRSSL
jgi:hypothetical protein